MVDRGKQGEFLFAVCNGAWRGISPGFYEVPLEPSAGEGVDAVACDDRVVNGLFVQAFRRGFGAGPFERDVAFVFLFRARVQPFAVHGGRANAG